MIFFPVISFAMLIIGLHVCIILATLIVKIHLACLYKTHRYQEHEGRPILTAHDTGYENVWAEILHVLAYFRMNFWLGRCHGNR